MTYVNLYNILGTERSRMSQMISRVTSKDQGYKTTTQMMDVATEVQKQTSRIPETVLYGHRSSSLPMGMI